MSSYKNFSRCVVCRSFENLKLYEKLKGEYEVTMLLNTLYLTVMYPVEQRGNLHIKAKKVAPLVRTYARVDECGNQFNDDELVRYLRNGLAHFNIKVTPENSQGEIENVKIWAKNLEETPKCAIPCEDPQCVPKQLSKKQSGEICIFRFTAKDLRAFTEDMINLVLNTLPQNECEKNNCKLWKEGVDSNGNTNI